MEFKATRGAEEVAGPHVSRRRPLGGAPVYPGRGLRA